MFTIPLARWKIDRDAIADTLVARGVDAGVVGNAALGGVCYCMQPGDCTDGKPGGFPLLS